MAELTLSCVEDQRFISIPSNEKMNCYWYAAYARVCALKGFSVLDNDRNWRSKCYSTFAPCGPGSVYEDCPMSCIQSCSDNNDNLESNSICHQQCLTGKSFLVNHDHVHVLYS